MYLIMTKQPKSGFALVIALGLMSLIVLLLLGITTFVRVESSAAAQSLRMLEARQNAMLGMQVALGELQAAAGPDQRSVARAELLQVDSRISESIGVDSSRRFWIGVSHSDGSSDFGPRDKPVHWLVSGLNPGRTASQQLTDPLPDPVTLIGAGSTNLSNPVETGRVNIDGFDGTPRGAFAWLVDDETQKAKLAPSNPSVSNASPAALLAEQRHVLPGFFDLEDVAGIVADAGQLGRASRLRNVSLIPGVDAEVAKERFFDYTLSGYGILSDTREGGLKRDLTAAFNRPNIFNNLFPNADAPPYIVMDMDKFNSSAAAMLRKYGYIHFNIFRDFYNLKHIASVHDLMDPTVFEKRLLNSSPYPGISIGVESGTLPRGTIFPHGFEAMGHPYGNFTVWRGRLNNDNPAAHASVETYQHNPITPVFSFMQQNARIWYDDGYRNTGTVDTPNWIRDVDEAKLQSQVQLWTGVYNPYNIRINLSATPVPDPIYGEGPRFIQFPQVRFSLWQNEPNSSTNNRIRERDPPGAHGGFGAGAGLNSEKLQIHAKESSILEPGQSQLFGFSNNFDYSLVIDHRSEFSSDISEAAQSHAFRDFKNNIDGNRLLLAPENPTDDPQDYFYLADLQIEFFNFHYAHLWSGSGLSYQPWYDKDNNLELFQVLWMPIAEDSIDPARSIPTILNEPRAGVVLNASDFELSKSQALAPSGFDLFGYRLRLRTTRESGDALRPLVDANIRAMWANPRWDSPLGLRSIATHRVERFEGSSPNPSFHADGTKGYLFWGPSIEPDIGQQRVILFDIPRDSLVSIGQLQHASAGRFSYEPSYIVGNSYANIRFSDLSNWHTSITDTFSSRVGIQNQFGITGSFPLFDGSYLVNEVLFDGYTFTTIPQGASDDELGNYLAQNRLLQNPRYLAYEPQELAFNASTLQAETSGRTNAGFVIVDGAFNVNSTSVDAWEVFLSGTKGLPFRKMNAQGAVTGFEDVDGVRFPRVQSILGEPWEENPDSNYWIGFRSLTRDEVRILAQAIVSLIRERGPFHNLSEFINRKLEDSEAGKAGVLQTALDRTVNAGLPGSFESPASGFDQISSDSTQGAGFPGQLLQGDILQALAPYMQTRSDTFTIRSYGEVRGVVDSQPVARAWYEVVVQRLPDPVAPSSLAGSQDERLRELERPTSKFGRKFEVLSSRWLTEDDI